MFIFDLIPSLRLSDAKQIDHLSPVNANNHLMPKVNWRCGVLSPSEKDPGTNIWEVDFKET